MFSFMKIATFVALAFGTLASAIPAPAPAPAAVAAIEARELSVRTASDVTGVLQGLQSDLAEPCGDLGQYCARVRGGRIHTDESTAAIVVKVDADLDLVDAAISGPPDSRMPISQSVRGSLVSPPFRSQANTMSTHSCR